MFTKALPALSDFLTDEGIQPIALVQAIDKYAELLAQHIDQTHDQFARPIEYLAIKDFEEKVLAFQQILPTIIPDDVDFEILDEDDDE